MTVVSPKSPISVGSVGTADKPLSNRAKAATRAAGWAMLSAIAVMFLPVTFGSLATSMLTGLTIGWIRTAWSIRNRFGESFVSALFGTSLDREHPVAVGLDLSLRAWVGFAVSLTFAGIQAAGPAPDGAVALLAFGAGGFGGGAGPGAPSIIAALAILLVLFALVGLVVALAFYGIERPLLEHIEDRAAAGGAKAIAKDASIRAVDRRAAARPVAIVVLQGVVTALLTALVHRLVIG